MVRRWSQVALLVLLGGCSTEPELPVLEVVGPLNSHLKDCLQMDDGASDWTWYAPHGGTRGEATLEVAGGSYRWSLVAAPDDSLILTPLAAGWLSLAVASPADLGSVPPLPRRPVESAAFTDLVSLARAFITPRFEGRVPHWPAWPVAVSSPEAISGDVDLAACLREAVELWNAAGHGPWFVWRDEGGVGIRLAHYAGSIRSPALSVSITRRDSLGRPLRVRIAAGDNYHSESARPYAVRGLAHELGHAVLLWGHSPDRGHLLWGDAPPLRATPSDDEVRAAWLLRHLPLGLDLGRYGLPEPPDGEGHQVINATGRPSSSGTAVPSPEAASWSAMVRNGSGKRSTAPADAHPDPAPDDRNASSIARSSQPSSLP
jgi:hypothetical protein